MNGVIYLICLLLLLPILGFAAFGALIDSLTTFGLWSVIKFIFAPLYDPFGRGLWLLLGLVSVLALIGAGFHAQARQFGFGAIALIGIACAAYVIKSYPHPWDFGSLLFFVPSAAGVGISIYCVARPMP